MTEKPLDLQVVIVSGEDDAHRAVFGFMTGLAAASSGLRVAVVLTMKGAVWAAETVGNEHPFPGYLPVAEYLANTVDMGGRVEGCATCIDSFCPAPFGPDGLKILRPGIVRVGLTEIVHRTAAGVATVTF